MRKLIAVAALAFFAVSCNKTEEVKMAKTAYVDTSKMMEEYTKAKDLVAKYKAKEEALQNELAPEASRLKAEEASFRSNAQQNGMAWAQANGPALQSRIQQFQYKQEQKMRQLQSESGNDMDTLIKHVKDFIKVYGKEKGYDYIYGTGEGNATVLYSKDQYDITKDVIKALNDKYASEGKTEETPATEAKK
jgi:outer membrane protein